MTSWWHFGLVLYALAAAGAAETAADRGKRVVDEALKARGLA